MNRIIPATMATQHPDNACSPFWEKGDGFVSTHEEVKECHAIFKDLDCQEFMWDWEGKYVDEAVVDRLFHTYYEYFKNQQLGRDKFLTFRIPNINYERGHSLARALMGILTAENFAKDLEFHSPPLFEVILPMADSATGIIKIQDTFTKLAIFKQKLFSDNGTFNYLNVWPLFESLDNLINCSKILNNYIKLHQIHFKRFPEYLRIHIARSDPALNSGLVPAVIAAKAAMSEAYRFGKLRDIKIYPAIGLGGLPFRGGLSPDRIEDFLTEYSGCRTAYIQSAFRYDYPLPKVIEAIKILNNKLPLTKPHTYSTKEIIEIKEICKIFSKPYRQTVEKIADVINDLSTEVPARRERKLHVGLFGYSRGIGKKRLPRAIPFTAVLYSLGIPPELIGTGRGLKKCLAARIDINKYYLNFKKDLLLAGKYLNKENLSNLIQINPAWQQIADDVAIIEKYFKIKLGPKSNEDFLHRNLSSSVYYLWRSKKPFGHLIIETGKIRKSIG